MSVVARRWGRALAEALEQTGQVRDSLSILQGLSNLRPEDLAPLHDRRIPLVARVDALAGCLGDLPTDSVIIRLLGALASRRRLPWIASICQEALSWLRRGLGEDHGVVSSREDLDPSSVATLEGRLATPGRKVRLTAVRDPSILAGYRVRLGHRLVDATFNRQLEQARRSLAGI